MGGKGLEDSWQKVYGGMAIVNARHGSDGLAEWNGGGRAGGETLGVTRICA